MEEMLANIPNGSDLVVDTNSGKGLVFDSATDVNNVNIQHLNSAPNGPGMSESSEPTIEEENTNTKNLTLPSPANSSDQIIIVVKNCSLLMIG